MNKAHLFYLLSVSLWFLFTCAENLTEKHSSVKGKIICLDPGHGGTAEVDSFRVGASGEREEWINLRVAFILRDLLEARGATVLMTRTADVPVPLKDRAQLAVQQKADVFFSIHHNATADTSVNFPIIYYHGNASENQASVELGKILSQKIAEFLYDSQPAVSLVSDHTIFPISGTAVLRHSYGIAGVIGEASFFSNPKEEKRLKNKEYNRREAEAYLATLEEFFSKEPLPVLEKYSTGKIEPFPVFQEAERMNEIAKRWREDFVKGEKLFSVHHPDSLKLAYDYFTRSAKSFPDSYLAGKCHFYRSDILFKMGKFSEAESARKRVKEFYLLTQNQEY